MGLVDIELFKKYLKADDFTDEVKIADALEKAEAKVLRDTYRTAEELTEMGGGKIPPDINMAIIMMGCHFYKQAADPVGSIQMNEIPYTYSFLVKPFRKLSKRED